MASPGESLEKPFHLRGNYAPVSEEVSAFDLPVEGALPPELDGLYLRNGPNPQSGESPHWFTGDGMVHGVRLAGGKAESYRNRWVRTRSFAEGAPSIGENGQRDLSAGSAANTNVIAHAGRILALVEICWPTELTRELETVGPWSYEGKLTSAMTAHPKLCPDTGELHFFGYGFAPPFLTYHVADAQGRLVKTEEIEVKGPTMIHDFAITARNVIFMDLPVVFSPEAVASGAGFPYVWSDDYGARLGVMPRGGSNADVRWTEIDPCYVFHSLNAYDEGGKTIVDAARYPELWRGGSSEFSHAHLHRFTIDLERGIVAQDDLDDRPVEFPRLDERITGHKHRYGYLVTNDTGVAEQASQIIKYDLESGASETHDFQSRRAPSEPVFVPAAPGGAEDEGWLLAFVYDPARNGSDLVVLDASRPSAAPVASVQLPQRVPFGFHGNWVPREALG